MNPAAAMSAIAVAVLGAACSLFGSAEQPTPLQQLQVVDDDAPFDPAQAVDDDDVENPAWPRDGEGRPPKPGPVPPLPEGERTATPDEVKERIDARRSERDALIASGVEPRDAKLALAKNPTAEDPGPLKPTKWTVLDWALEGTLVVVASGAWTLLFVFARRIPVAVWTTLAVVCVATLAFVLLQQE